MDFLPNTRPGFGLARLATLARAALAVLLYGLLAASAGLAAAHAVFA